MTGAGIDSFFTAVDAKVEEYNRDYLPELQRVRAQREKEKEKYRTADEDRPRR